MDTPRRPTAPAQQGAPQEPAEAPELELESASAEELRREVVRLRGEVQRLEQERDRAVKSRDAVIAQVLPLAGSGPREEPTGRPGRGVLLLLLLLLLVALLLLVETMPKVLSAFQNTPLPPGVEERQ